MTNAFEEDLYDYVFRMTGQMERAQQTVVETIDCILAISGASPRGLATHQNKVLAFKTARNFCQDIWNADTTQLKPYQYPEDDVPALEEKIAGLPGSSREITLLKHKFGFEDDDIASICSLRVDALNQSHSLFPDEIDQMINLRNYRAEEDEENMTQDLSQVIKDVRKTNLIKFRGWKRYFAYLLIPSIAALAYYLLEF